jgi:tripartite-type tricarboxylate transporter receptor subunit TctC
MRLQNVSRFGCAIVAGILLAGGSHEASAQRDKAALFKDKTMTIMVGAAPGGGLDTYARLISRHMQKHIPGNPIVIVSNQPGAGGSVVARNIYSTAPKDGTTIGLVFPSVLIDPLYSDATRPFDANQFRYLGNANPETPICFFRQDAPVKTLADVLTIEVVLGGTTPGSPVVDFPNVTKTLLGAKWRLIQGYRATRDVLHAIESREIQGTCGIGWATVKVAIPQTLAGGGFGRIFAQEDNHGHPDLNAAGIPLMTTLAKEPAARAVLEFLYGQNAISRPFILPPGIPDDRLADLRDAFMATTRDPELQAEARKMQIDVEPITGAEVQEIVRRLYDTPTPVVTQLKRLLDRK